MSKASKKAKAKTVGAFGEDKANKPVIPLPLAPEPIEIEPAPGPDRLRPPRSRPFVPPVETSAKPKNQPKTWPFKKSNEVNEKKEMEHVSRLVNMKHDNPGVVKVTKVVVYDCLSRQVECSDYKIEYNKE